MVNFEVAVGVFFALWLALTVVLQFEPKVLLRLDFHGFVPSCRFFAPNPMVTDTRIYFACPDFVDQPLNDLIWHPLLEAKRGQWSFFWNPGLRLSKTANILARQIHKVEGLPRVEFTLPYLRLLMLASAAAGEDESSIRFLLTRHRGIQSPDRYVSFVSSDHRLTSR